MAELPETPSWEGVYQIEEEDPVQGGPDGVDNQPHKNLANRTKYLKNELENHAANDSAHRTPAKLLTAIKTVDGSGSGLDADKLDGVELSAIQAEIDSDINAHKANASAHHSRHTPATILSDLKTVDGSGSGLDADKLDGVELSAIRSEIDGDINAHAANASAHHTKYTNANAVSAMGSKANNNPLNHDRHTPATILSDLKTVDGSGSGLDADKLDGVELSAIQNEIDSDIATHKNLPAAHHTRYSDSEAIAAVEAGKVAFRARIPSGQAIPSDGSERVQWDATDFNEGGGYSTTTFYFTAPSDGYYFFHAQLYLFGLDLPIGTKVSLKLRHNSGSIAYDYREITHKDSQLGLPCLQVTAVENANAGDTFNVRVSHNNSGKTVYVATDTEFSFFCGHRI